MDSRWLVNKRRESGQSHTTIMPNHHHSLGQLPRPNRETAARLKKLTEALRKSAGKPMSRAQRDKQVISWVYGQLPARMGITKEQVEEYLKDIL